MTRVGGIAVICCALWPLYAGAETFVIEADKAGHEATIKIPAAAVTNVSADRAEALEGYAGPQVEAMRLSGDVFIRIIGGVQPIEIKADTVVLELTADADPAAEHGGRATAATNKLVRTTSQHAGVEDSQVFSGNVVFALETSSGPVEIRAARVEHQLAIDPGT